MPGTLYTMFSLTVPPLRRCGPVYPPGVSGGGGLEAAEPQPRRQRLELSLDSFGHGPREPDVLVDRVYPQRRRLAIGDRVELADEAISVEDRQREVAPAPFGGRLVHLEVVLEVEELLRASAVVDQPVERRQERRATLEVVGERRRVDDPSAGGSLDLGGLALDLLVVALPGHAEHLGARDSQRSQPAHREDPAGLAQRDGLHGRIDTLGEIPQPLPANATRDRHLPTRVEELEHLGDVAVAGPAARLPGHHARIRYVARRQRPRSAQELEDVPAKGSVRLEPAVRGRPGHGDVAPVLVRER